MHRDSSRGTVYVFSFDARQACYMCSDEHDGLLKLCYFCFLEDRKVALHRSKARKLHLPGDLTLEQWMRVVRLFQWKCAYCLEQPYGVLEHFLPHVFGGGTTISNCIPACYGCNARKKNKHPDFVTSIPQDALERVRVFLKSQKLPSK